jgi:glycosyltransferase involved in cell wall biosynthesis
MGEGGAANNGRLSKGGMKTVAYLTNASPFSGVGHRAHHIKRALATLAPGLAVVEFMLDGERALLSKQGRPVRSVRTWPGAFGSKSINWWRLGHQLRRYVRHQEKTTFGLYHATNQTLSFLAHHFSPMVITVHDLIELAEPQEAQARFINHYLYGGIRTAAHVVTVSHYTKKTVQELLNVSENNITVVPNGVSNQFHPIADFSQSIGCRQLRAELRLRADARPIVLYVGSDHPRKNVPVAISAFAALRQEYPQAVFVKVGRPGLLAGRLALLHAIDAVGARQAVRFVDKTVDEHTLNELYNLADLLIFPSRHEGFGLPPLQAMAAGTPVVCSNATSLPEVVGDGHQLGDQAAAVHHPDDIDGFTTSMRKIIEDRGYARLLRQKGLKRAEQFSWQTAASQICAVYRKLV